MTAAREGGNRHYSRSNKVAPERLTIPGPVMKGGEETTQVTTRAHHKHDLITSFDLSCKQEEFIFSQAVSAP